MIKVIELSVEELKKIFEDAPAQIQELLSKIEKPNAYKKLKEWFESFEQDDPIDAAIAAIIATLIDTLPIHLEEANQSEWSQQEINALVAKALKPIMKALEGNCDCTSCVRKRGLH